MKKATISVSSAGSIGTIVKTLKIVSYILILENNYILQDFLRKTSKCCFKLNVNKILQPFPTIYTHFGRLGPAIFVSWCCASVQQVHQFQILNPNRSFLLEIMKKSPGEVYRDDSARWSLHGQAYLDLQRQVGADGVQQQFGGLLLAHEHQLQIHVPFDQKAFGHQTDTRHPAEQRHAVRPEARNTQMQSELVRSPLPYLIISQWLKKDSDGWSFSPYV